MALFFHSISFGYTILAHLFLMRFRFSHFNISFFMSNYNRKENKLQDFGMKKNGIGGLFYFLPPAARGTLFEKTAPLDPRKSFLL